MQLRMRANVAAVVAAVLGITAGGAGAAQAGTVVFSSSRCADEADHAARPPAAVPGQDTSACEEALWVVGDDGGGLRRVPPTGEPGTDLGGPATWSPDGQELLLGRGGGLALLELLSGRVRTLTTGGAAYSDVADRAGHFSPDGSRVVFTSTRPADDRTARPDGDVWVVNRDGSGLHRVTEGSGVDLAPRFTADGRAIVFVRQPFLFAQGATEPGIYVVGPEGGTPTRVSAGQTGIAVTAVTPSPDGRFLAISSFSGLVVARADGSDARAIVRIPAPDPVTWAASRVIFPLADARGAHLVSADVTAPQPDVREVTRAPGTDHAADWTALGPVLGVVGAPVKPLVVLTGDLAGAVGAAAPAGNPLAFFALAARGRAVTTASVQRLAGTGCRAWDGRRLRGGCSRARWVATGGPARWAAKVRTLPAGRYRVRVRVRDGRTGATRSSVARTVRLTR